MKPKRSTDEPSVDEERIRVRDVILAAASATLAEVVFTCAESLPMSDIAALVDGDARVVRDVLAGSRADVAAELRARSSRRQIHALADMLLTAPPTPGHLPCVFIVGLEDGSVDVSVVMLKMDAVH